MKKILGLAGVVAASMMLGMTAFATENYTVTDTSAVLYSNSNAVLYEDADTSSTVVVDAESFPDGEAVLVTGITSNGFFQVDMGGVTYYVPGEGLQDTADVDTTESDTAAVTADIAVLAEYTEYPEYSWAYTYRFLIVQNNLSETVDITTSSIAYSANGTILASDNGSVNAVGPGCISIIVEAFRADDTIAYYTTDISYSASYSESVLQDLTYVVNQTGNGAVVQVTNHGTDVADFVEGYMLFFKNGAIVDHDEHYFVDNDNEIKPGYTLTEQFSTYDDFDSVQLYLTGKRYTW